MQPAVFYDVDGTLVAGTVVHPLAWYAAHQSIPTRSLARTVGLLSRIPFYWVLDQISRQAFNTLFYREYRGMTRNRLLTLAELMFEAMIKPRIYVGAMALIERVRAQGMPQALVTGALDFTIAPLAKHLGIKHVIANRLVFSNGIATGELTPPLIAGNGKVVAIRRFAKAHGIDLMASYAYADSESDVPMLSAVGHPTVVCPTWRLRRAAKIRRWQVIRWN